MEIFIDNCIATHLFMNSGFKKNYGIPHNRVSRVCNQIINWFSSDGNSMVCCPTLLSEFSFGMKINPIDRRIRYIARCDPRQDVSSLSKFCRVHYDNYEIFSEILDRVEKYLGVNFSTMSAYEISRMIEKNHGVSRYLCYRLIQRSSECGSISPTIRTVAFNGKIDLTETKELGELVSNFSESPILRVFIYYILSAIFVEIKGDVVFPLIVTKKGRDRRKSLISDFLYLYFMLDRKIVFLSSDKGLIFRAASVIHCFDLKSAVIEFNIVDRIKSLALTG